MQQKAEMKKILLAHAAQGREYEIVDIAGGHCLISRLNSMGIMPGDLARVIHQTWGGPMTIAVKGVRIALGRGIAHKIVVQELPGSNQ
jgi:Fe2+ transport system protein FeoA